MKHTTGGRKEIKSLAEPSLGANKQKYLKAASNRDTRATAAVSPHCAAAQQADP
jgi:hypothetical protein